MKFRAPVTLPITIALDGAVLGIVIASMPDVAKCRARLHHIFQGPNAFHVEIVADILLAFLEIVYLGGSNTAIRSHKTMALEQQIC